MMQDCSGNFLIVPDMDQSRRRSSETDLTLLPLGDSRRRSSSLRNLIQGFDSKAQEHDDNQRLNPFSSKFDKNYRPAVSKEEYGRPKPGSKSEARGAEAFVKTYSEMLDICTYIDAYGEPVTKRFLGTPEGALKCMRFGSLFDIYATVSGSLLGMLVRARKNGFITFEGEVLYQGSSDDEVVFLMRPIKDIREKCNQKMDEKRRSVTPQPI